MRISAKAVSKNSWSVRCSWVSEITFDKSESDSRAACCFLNYVDVQEREYLHFKQRFCMTHECVTGELFCLCVKVSLLVYNVK